MMFCNKCGTQTHNSNFCVGCGAPLGAYHAPSYYPAPMQYHTRPAQNKSSSCAFAIIIVIIALIFTSVGVGIGIGGVFLFNRNAFNNSRFDRAQIALYDEGFTINLVGSDALDNFRDIVEQGGIRGIQRMLSALHFTKEDSISVVQFNTDSNAREFVTFLLDAGPVMPDDMQVWRRGNIIFTGTPNAARIVRDAIGGTRYTNNTSRVPQQNLAYYPPKTLQNRLNCAIII